ncbi:hypothetical protein AAVH_19565 [Aphelenchoides avenae]|nr:hypothetical protein AAVH_19565 [Aphelenchus avenae]
MPPRLADFIDEDAAALVAIVLDVSFALTTLIIPVPIYLIVKAKTIGRYRWYMLNGLVWDYAYDATLTLLKPVLFFPFMGGYVTGPLPVIGNSWDFRVVVHDHLRDARHQPDRKRLRIAVVPFRAGRLHDLSQDARTVCLLYVAAHLLFHICLVGGFLAYVATSGGRPMEVVESFADVHEFADNHGFYAVKRSAGAEAICWTAGGILVIFFVTGLGLTAALLHRARQFSTGATYRLQMMLVRAFVAQMLIGCVCGLWPIVVVAFLLAAGSPASGPGMNVFLVLSSFHGTLDTLVILYFVKPYRRAVLRALLQVRVRLYGYVIPTTSPAVSAWN